MARTLGLLDAVANSFDRLTQTLVRRFGDTIWLGLHGLGAHRWRDGYEVDVERGWRQYRGSRCTVCDIPWEGW
jgi:hypothetical protein